MIYLKILASLLVIAASSGIGVNIGAFYNRRTGDLRELILFAGIIKGNLTYSASEITDIIGEGANKTNGAVSVWLADILDRLSGERRETFENIWVRSIDVLRTESYLSEEQIGEAKELGKWLCYMDADAQVKNIMLWENNITYEYEEQRQRANRINKVSKSLGLLSGILLVVLIY